MKKSLKELYVEYAILHCISTISGNYRKTNKAYDKLTKILKTVEKSYSDEERKNFFNELLDDDNEYVKIWSAAHCLYLKIFEKKSIVILKKIANSNAIEGIIRFDAEMTLKEYKKNGGLKF